MNTQEERRLRIAFLAGVITDAGGTEGKVRAVQISGIAPLDKMATAFPAGTKPPTMGSLLGTSGRHAGSMTLPDTDAIDGSWPLRVS
jgi:hypothetical protein